MLPAAILVLAVSGFVIWNFLVKPSSETVLNNTVSNSATLNDAEINEPVINIHSVVITLFENKDRYHYNTQYYPPAFLNTRITEEDIFTISYSFSSNISFDWLAVILIDTTVEKDNYDTPLSSNYRMAANVEANTEYTGVVTIMANKTASSIEPNANMLNFATGPFTSSQLPILNFSKFEIVKNN